MDKRIVALLMITAALFSFVPVQAADYLPPLVIVPDDVETAVQDLLVSKPPCDCQYFVITDINLIGLDYFVSVAGLDDVADPDEWSLEDNGSFIGLVTAHRNGDDSLTTTGDWDTELPDPMIPRVASDDDFFYFPWAPGTKMFFGSRGVHGSGDYGTSGWRAVDWVSGTDLGSDAAPNTIYASQSATIDYVCRGSINVAIRAGDFLYAHLVDNSYLRVGNNLSRGQAIGTLVTGTFDDNCGWASQQPDHYHVHWMFKPSNGHMVVENWVLDVGSETWTSSADGSEVGVNDWMLATWAGQTLPPGPPHATPDPNGDPTGPPGGTVVGAGTSIWDGVVGLIVALSDAALAMFPTHQAMNIGITYLSAAGSVIRIFYVLVKSNFNMGVTLFVVGMIFVLEPIRIIRNIYLMIKDLIPGAG